MRNNLARKINRFKPYVATFFNSKWVLIAILLLGLAFRLKYFVGMFRFDGYFYAQLSYFISQGDLHSFFFENNNFFAIGRLILFLPTGLTYRFFGVSDLSSVAPILIISILHIVVIYFLGKKLVSPRVGIIAAFLLAIYPLDVYYATQFLPDGLIPFFLSVAALAFLYGESEKNVRGRLLLYFLVGVFIGFAQHVRENAFIFTMVPVIYLLFKRKLSLDYIWIIVGGLVIFTLSGAFFYFGTGDFFFQINQVLLQFSSTSERLADSPERVIDWLGFTKFLFSGVLFKPFSLLLFVSLLFTIFKKNNKLIFVLVWFFALLFYLEVISPLHGSGKNDRYLAIITVPILLIISSFIVSMIERYKIKLFLTIIILALLIIPSRGVVKSLSSQTILQKHFVTNRALANSLVDRPSGNIYIKLLQHKGYVYNYILGFDRLNYNSFQRQRTEGTDSLLRDWDGEKLPEAGSYVVVDSNILKKRVQSNWQLVASKLNRSLYYIPKTDE